MTDLINDYEYDDTEEDRYTPKRNATREMISKMVTEGLREDEDEVPYDQDQG